MVIILALLNTALIFGIFFIITLSTHSVDRLGAETQQTEMSTHKLLIPQERKQGTYYVVSD